MRCRVFVNTHTSLNVIHFVEFVQSFNKRGRDDDNNKNITIITNDIHKSNPNQTIIVKCYCSLQAQPLVGARVCVDFFWFAGPLDLLDVGIGFGVDEGGGQVVVLGRVDLVVGVVGLADGGCCSGVGVPKGVRLGAPGSPFVDCRGIEAPRASMRVPM